MIQGYINWALLAGFVFGYGLLAGALKDRPVSAAMVFLFAGWLLGPEVLGWLSFRVDSESLRTITEFSLALILFTDAANANLPVLRDSARLPARLLAVGETGLARLGGFFLEEIGGGVLVGCFTAAQAIGGSEFIACFCGGLAMGGLSRSGREEDLVAAESTGDVLSLITWMIFGAAVLPRAIAVITATTMLYAHLSLTLVRMLPVALVTAGLRLDPRTTLFLGWFGPHGLASIVFAVMILDSALPHGQAVAEVIALTVLMSVVLHGLSATPLVNRLAGRWKD